MGTKLVKVNVDVRYSAHVQIKRPVSLNDTSFFELTVYSISCLYFLILYNLAFILSIYEAVKMPKKTRKLTALVLILILAQLAFPLGYPIVFLIEN